MFFGGGGGERKVGSFIESSPMAWQAHGSAEGAVIGTLGVCTGQDACLVLLGLPAVQEGGQIEIGVLLVLPFPLPVEAEILSLWGCLG